MTVEERVRAALADYDFKSEGSDINAVIAYAYYLGRCEVARELCDEAHEIFAEQLKRAESVRYHEMAKAVQGNKTMLFHSDYDQWVKLFKNDLSLI